MDVMDLPVTLIIKAPNGKTSDLHVEGKLDWTISHLKRHLTKVYPTHPPENQQKLIYLGRLLTDQQTLKEVFKNTYDPQATAHTLHLLCTGTQNVSPSASSQSAIAPTQDGVRFRGSTQSPDSSASTSSPQQATNTSTSQSASTSTTDLPTPASPLTSAAAAFPQWAGPAEANGPPPGYTHQQWAGPAGANGPPPGYTHEQWMWWQQMYQHQMAYMHYMQQLATGNPAAPPPAFHYPGAPTPPGNAAPQGEQAPQPNAPQQQQARGGGGGGMVMNAAGGGGMMDDDEMENRDWLDWMYIFSRVSVLVMVVWFYSTFSRFIAVSVLVFLMYLAQRGFFGGGRNERQERIVDEVDVPAENAQQPENAENQENNEEGAAAAAADEGDAQANEANDAAPPAAPPPPPRPSPIRVTWTFIRTLVTSLIPQQPGAVNAN